MECYGVVVYRFLCCFFSYSYSYSHSYSYSTLYLFFSSLFSSQVYIAFLPPQHPHSEASLTFIFLASCLSYANSAMNPILYAFLSENFKKSFAKAFTCAANKEVNAHLNVENSANPRTTRAGSSRGPNVAGHSSHQQGERLALRQSQNVTGTRHRTEKTAHGDEDELEDEEEEEIVELEDSPNAIPMTTRISSYVGSVMSNREQRITHDRQILIPSQNTTAMNPSTPL